MPQQLVQLPEAYRKEYAEFVALAVHELDAPLRKLSVLIDRLDLNSSLSTDGNPYFPRIKVCLADMRSIVNTLDKLSGCTTERRETSACDFGQIIGKIRNDSPLLQKEGVLHVSSLPVIMGDSSQIEILFRNLLENATKFVKKGVAPKVNVEATVLSPEEYKNYPLKTERTYYKISVNDNGIGFAQKDRLEIFKPFVRLHGKSEYPGNGIGLAICKKITENHEGIIYAEAIEDEGARFILILPLSLN